MISKTKCIRLSLAVSKIILRSLIIMPLFLSSCQRDSKVYLKVSTSTPAQISVDEIDIDTAPIRIKVTPGVHTIKATENGYEPQIREVVVFDNTPLNVSIVMPVSLPTMLAVPNSWFYESISPDNQWWAASDQTGVMISKTGQTNWIPLLSQNDNSNGFAEWSPDGSKLITYFPYNQIRLYQTGQWDHPDVIYPGGQMYSGPRWSPDSKMLVLCEESPDDSLTVTLLLWKLGGTFQPLIKSSIFTIIGKNRCSYVDPFWSPDGKNILYKVQISGNPPIQQVWQVNIETLQQRMLFELPNWADLVTQWSTDGQKVYIIEGCTTIISFDFQTNALSTVLADIYGDDPPENRLRCLWSPTMKYIALDLDYPGANGDGLNPVVSVLSLETGELRQIADGGHMIIRWTSDESAIIVEDYEDHVVKYLPVR